MNVPNRMGICPVDAAKAAAVPWLQERGFSPNLEMVQLLAQHEAMERETLVAGKFCCELYRNARRLHPSQRESSPPTACVPAPGICSKKFSRCRTPTSRRFGTFRRQRRQCVRCRCPSLHPPAPLMIIYVFKHRFPVRLIAVAVAVWTVTHADAAFHTLRCSTCSPLSHFITRFSFSFESGSQSAQSTILKRQPQPRKLSKGCAGVLDSLTPFSLMQPTPEHLR